MKHDYTIYEKKYQEARTKGWSGWGGDKRMATEHLWLDRLFSYTSTPQSGKVLELGCGEGHYSRLIAERGYEVTGIDISPTAIRWAKEKSLDSGHRINYSVTDLTKPTRLESETFDLIVDGNCLHCIIGDDRKIFLDNVHQLLKSNGFLFISSLCSHSKNDEIIDLDGKPYRHIPTQSSIQCELELAGFAIEKQQRHTRTMFNHYTAHLSKKKQKII